MKRDGIGQIGQTCGGYGRALHAPGVVSGCQQSGASPPYFVLPDAVFPSRQRSQEFDNHVR